MSRWQIFVSSLSKVIVRHYCNYCPNKYAHTHLTETRHCRYQGHRSDGRSAALPFHTRYRRKSLSRYGRAPAAAQGSPHLLRGSTRSSHNHTLVLFPYTTIRSQGIKKLWRERSAAILSIGSRARLSQFLLLACHQSLITFGYAESWNRTKWVQYSAKGGEYHNERPVILGAYYKSYFPPSRRLLCYVKICMYHCSLKCNGTGYYQCLTLFCEQCEQEDSNLWLLRCKRSALPTELCSHVGEDCCLVGGSSPIVVS